MGPGSLLGVRPHDLSPVGRPGSDELVIEGTLTLIEPAGPVTFLDVALGDGSLLKATCPDPRTHRPGEPLMLAVPRGSVSVFDAASGVGTGVLAPPGGARVRDEVADAVARHA